MAALGTWVAGPYTATLDSQSLGILDPQGEGRAFQLSMQIFQQIVTGHTYGRTPIDSINQGGDHLIRFIAEEQIVAAMKACWFLSETATAAYAFADMSVPGTIGAFASDKGKTLVLTAVAGTQAASRGPATLTALVYPTEQTKELILDSSLRKFPAELRMFLQDYSGTKRFWSNT